jgi:hypothetical protein
VDLALPGRSWRCTNAESRGRNNHSGAAQKRDEQRQKQRRITFRLSPEEYRNLETAATGAGLTMGTYIRGQVLDAPTTGRRRRPSVEVQAITRLQGEMNRIGGNIHQILKRVNFGETPLAYEFHEALTGYREVIGAIMSALGRGPR